jgi:hypothetical protein
MDEGTGEAEGGRAVALGRGEPELSDIIDRRRDGEGKAPSNEKMKHQKKNLLLKPWLHLSVSERELSSDQLLVEEIVEARGSNMSQLIDLILPLKLVKHP